MRGAKRGSISIRKIVKKKSEKDASMSCHDTVLPDPTTTCGPMTRLPDPAAKPDAEPDMGGTAHTLEAIPLDWDEAVRIATSLLKELYELPDTMDDPTAAAQAETLAALLCAYDLLPLERRRMLSHTEHPLLGKSPLGDAREAPAQAVRNEDPTDLPQCGAIADP
jgi:hypothetical protein